MSTAFFPYDVVREKQDKLVQSVANAVKNNSNLVVHAPTGLGKTAKSCSNTC